MNRIHKSIVFLLVFLLSVTGAFYAVFADEGDHKEQRRYQKRERRHSKNRHEVNLATVNNSTYAENCGECHIPYQPGLLPSGSWNKILINLNDHFGEDIALDMESQNTIAEFLKANGADFSSAKLSAKIMKSLGDQTPQRITEIPCFQKSHHEIGQDVIKRKSIGSLSNCSACHTMVEKGIYSEDNTKIPK